MIWSVVLGNVAVWYFSTDINLKLLDLKGRVEKESSFFKLIAINYSLH